MRRVLLESPFAGRNAWQRFLNRRYARACLKDALMRGEAPIASHLLYTQVLDDRDPQERAMGVNAGLSWLPAVDASVVYVDRGISAGMREGIAAAKFENIKVEFRSLHGRIRVADEPSGDGSFGVTLLLDAAEGLPAARKDR